MRNNLAFAVFIAIGIGIVACTPPRSSDNYGNVPLRTTTNLYEVEGEGEEYFEARKNAICKGVEKAIVELIGKSKFEHNYSSIQKEILYDRKVISEVAEFSSTDIFDRQDKKVVKGIVKVKMNVLKLYLDKIELREYSTPTHSYDVSKPVEDYAKSSRSNENRSVSSPVISSATSPETYSPKLDGPKVEEFSIPGDSPLHNVSFLVFVPNDKIPNLSEEEEYKLLIETINSKLSEFGLDYVDFKRANELSKKFCFIYEEKTGEAMSLAQMLAQELKAGVYIEADVSVKYNLVSGNLVDMVLSGSIKSYDASTGKGLGMVNFSKHKKSSKGIFIAKTESITEVVETELPKLLRSIEEYFSKGVKIEVTIIGFKNLSEEKEISLILDSLPGTESKKRKSAAGNTSEYEIMYRKGVSQFVDDLIDVLSADPKFSKATIDQSVNKVILKLR